MKTFVNPKNNDIAVATSLDPYHHTVDIKDDFGNIKETIHYHGVTTTYVETMTSQRGFVPGKGEKF